MRESSCIVTPKVRFEHLSYSFFNYYRKSLFSYEHVLEAMKPHLEIDLNISLSCWDDDEDAISNVEEIEHFVNEFNFDLNYSLNETYVEEKEDEVKEQI